MLEHIKDEQYTRYPVYESDIDHIIGTLHVKDLLKYIDNSEEKFSIKLTERGEEENGETKAGAGSESAKNYKTAV